MRLFEGIRERIILNKSTGIRIPLSSPTVAPFFIVSSGRSGTTLLRKKLLEYAHIHIPPESDDLIPRNARYFILSQQKEWFQLAQDIFAVFKSSPCFPFWHMDLDRLLEPVKKVPLHEQSYAKLIDMIYRHHAGDDGAPLLKWGDKTPFLMYFLPWLRATFPAAKYIHLFRDGRAAVNSMKKYQGYTLERAAIRWRDSIRLFELHKNVMSPGNILEISYEDFVLDPQRHIDAIFSFLELPKTLRQSASETLLGDDVLPHHVNLSKPVTNEHVDRWKEELTHREIQELNRLLKKELRLKNYH
jgi:protein-tyrosine sulfotransferase